MSRPAGVTHRLSTRVYFSTGVTQFYPLGESIVSNGNPFFKLCNIMMFYCLIYHDYLLTSLNILETMSCILIPRLFKV